VNKDPTLTGRTALWFYADRLIWENPIYGIGYDAFWVRTNAVAVALFNTANGGGWTDFASDGPIHMGFSFHNLFYEVAVELGGPGVVAATIYIMTAFGFAVRWMRSGLSSESIFFFTVMVFVLIFQTQNVDLFVTFNMLNCLFMIAFLYSRKWAVASEPKAIRSTIPMGNVHEPIGNY
jgi:exopolysaccharide production protein ExoQ